MIKKISDFLSGTAMTVVSGAFLALSLALTLSGKSIGLDPAWGSVLISGIPLLYLALWRIRHNRGISKISSALLISIAMFAAIAIGDLFAAGEVAFIMAIGAILEEKTTQRAKKGLRNLLRLVPQQGRRIAEGKEECIPASQIRKNDILRILPGEAIPVDGIILRGETSLDQSIMTGESLPVDKGEGDSVFCGTINRFGVVEIRATKVGEDSSLQKLIHMVQEAESRQAPMQRIADRWASWLVPVALLIALAAYLFSGNIVTGVTILVVFCPCALVLATPTAIMAAIGQATKHGVIIKSGEALERMGKVDTLAFDKTGTITFGRPEVSDIAVFENSLTERELLVLAASEESHSEHPLGKAIVAFAQSEGLGLLPVEDFQMRAGKGISARVGGKKLLCGSERFLRECGIEPETSRMKTLDLLREQGKASILVADEKSCLGVIALADVLRPSAKEIVSDLEKTGARAVLFTGDNRKAAHYFARQAGISAVQAELLPEEKVASIAQLQKEGRVVCMIGDGVNDAPALKSADVGVAMGGIGSDIAVDAADIALVGDDLRKIPYLKRLSSATVGTIKLSILLSLCINFVAIVLSLLGVLTPTSGALVHNAGSCLVVLIAALLYDRKFE